MLLFWTALNGTVQAVIENSGMEIDSPFSNS